ncbi:2Fe-2S iron-sulfur cluster-binding protein [Parasphingopyxis sp.]|uniref:2Fe-2S iron-sulfur cluster-binding protein n=1 Tax=Parasphingopyxis sp. TaxID=1920299 RepID=UPI002601BDCC|nr:2Fe-2S iron-sulfur cluster-binding protein [Parasphingopyxis sp.]
MVTIIAVDRKGEEHRVDAVEGEPLMVALRDNDIDVEAVCGGEMSCLTCHVYIDPKWLDRVGERPSEEADLLDDQLHSRPESRLSCQIMISPNLEGLRCRVAPPEG